MEFVKLGSVCKLRNGYAFKSKNFTESGVPIIRISNISDNVVTPQNSVRTIYEKQFDNFKINNGDILIAMSGATTGKYGIYKSEEIAYQNQRVGCFKILDRNRLDQDYLFHVLNTIKPIIKTIANGGAQTNISSTSIEGIEIFLPSLSDQTQIAKILTQADKLIQMRKESIKLLDEFLKSTFLEMFGDPLKNEKKWKYLTGEKYLSKLTVGVVTKPASHYVEEGVIALRSLNVKPNRIDLSNLVYFSKIANETLLSKSILNEGDVVFVRTGMTGTAAIIPKELDGCNCIDLIIARPKEDLINSKYLVFFFNSDIGKRIVLSNEVGGIQKHFNVNALKKINIPIPPIQLQNLFATIVEKVESLKNSYESSLLELENMYGALSQKAFKGEINLNKINLELSKTELKTPVGGSLEPHIETENIPVFPEKVKHIKDMSLDEYYGIPKEIIAKYGSIDDHNQDQELLLKKIFYNRPVDLSRLEEIYNKIYSHHGKYFEFEDWKKFIFEEISKPKPFLKQKYNSETNQLEIVINEIKKA
ncbi:restriction endonuclease subunit S [Chryseobacterium sp. CP-77]|uniref:restriction endonuclease subunit S n=1 Tax=Chryseobacterium sp. CP-77 TaxID=3116594 RepID=UPI002ED65411